MFAAEDTSKLRGSQERCRCRTGVMQPSKTRPVVTKIRLYPVKSCRSVLLPSCRVKGGVLDFDRLWAVVLEDTNVVASQKAIPALTRVQPSINDFQTGALTLVNTLDGSSLSVPGHRVESPPASSGPPLLPMTVMCRGAKVQCTDVGDEAAVFLTQMLHKKVRLVRQTLHSRDVEASVNADWGSQISFAELGDKKLSLPKTLVPGLNFGNRTPWCFLSEESIDFINDNDAGLIVEEERYRANVIVKDASVPFAEDTWARFGVVRSKEERAEEPGEADEGKLEFCYVRSAPRRCVMVGMDQKTGDLNKAILALMQEKRSIGGAVPDVGALVCCVQGFADGVIRVGDVVEILDRREAQGKGC